jgi:uncharacterized repeat protein (TIGR03806 family)
MLAACGSQGNVTTLIGLERPSAAVVAMPQSLEAAAPGWTVVEAFPGLGFDDPLSLQEGPGTGHLFVTERDGRIYAFPNDPGASSRILSLDLSDRNQGDSDSGVQSLTFHPEFGRPGSPNRSYVYVVYAYLPGPFARPPRATVTHFRLSRFSMDLGTLVIDPASELVLIDQEDESVWHQGGAAFFGPEDGFLYLSVGDEGLDACQLRNCQRIDNDLFSGVLRIDVDQRGGDVSHPIRVQPKTGTTAGYYIPSDNPFVGRPGALEEFYAIGLRSPHRMTHDPIDHITWIGEVGQARHEELDVLQPGANFQWNVLEGISRPGGLAMPAEPLGVWTGPVLEMNRADAASVIGGYVYRGSRLPYLYGKYIFADFVRGSIWALAYTYDGARASVANLELLTSTAFRDRTDGITSFGVDAAGELYILTLGAASKIMRLDRTQGFSNAPLRLSETGVFVDTSSDQLEAAPGFVPYDVAAPLWSDGATKQRWISVPDGAALGYSEAGSWSFPEGTVLVKHFDLALDAGNPAETRRLETRLLVHGAGDTYYGVTYRWNAEGTDAELVLEGQTEPIEVALDDGRARQLQYFYPGPSDCSVCHNPDAGSVLGVRTAQLNHDFLYPALGRETNLLYTWSVAGLVDVALEEDELGALPALVPLTDETAPLEARVRSYWASNCSMCHGSVPDIAAAWDARLDVPLDRQGVLYGPSQSATSPGAFLVAPSDPEGSVLYQRSATSARGLGMPPIGRSVPDPAYVATLEQWIRSLPPEPAPAAPDAGALETPSAAP